MDMGRRIANSEKLGRLSYATEDINEIKEDIGEKFTRIEELYYREVGEPLPREVIEERVKIWGKIEDHHSKVIGLLVKYEQKILKEKD